MFNVRLRNLRLESQMSTKELSERLDVTIRSVQYYEKGSVEPSLTVLKKIADLFSVSTDYLLGRTDKPN